MNAIHRSLGPWCLEKYHHLAANLGRGAHQRKHSEKSLWAELAHERQLENELWLILAAAGLLTIAAAAVLV